MKRVKVRALLFSSLMLMTVIPLVGAYLQIHDVLNSSFSLTREDESVAALEIGQNALKELAKKSPPNESKYHEQFTQVQNLKLNLLENSLLKQRFINSFSSYFFAGFALILLVSLSLAFFLSIQVSAAYGRNLDELIRQKERSRFLEGLAHWQEVAKQLAHEIKGPLLPIKIWMSNLTEAFAKTDLQESFPQLLAEAKSDIDDEIRQLQKLVDSFTQFSRLPEINLAPHDLNDFLADFLERYKDIWEVDWNLDCPSQAFNILADPNLLRQVLTNLVNNAVEANPEINIRISMVLSRQAERACLIFENSGRVITADIALQIFEPYYTTKRGSANFGLGLSIVRKIILEHHGDITLEPCANGAKFKISFPLIGGTNG